MLRKLSTFKRGFASTFALDVAGRGLSAIATVLFIRALDVDSFAYLVLFLNVGQFAGSALTGGVRMRYMRMEAERVSRGDAESTGFALAWGASLALVLCVATLFVAGGTLAGGGDTALFVALATAFTAGHASVELAMYHHQAHLRFMRAGLIGFARAAALLAVALLATLGIVDSGTGVAACAAFSVLGVALIACGPLALETLRARRLHTIRSDFGRESAWLTVYYLASAGFSYATVFVVAALLDDEAVASYGAALRYCSIVLGPTPALLAVLRVRTSQHDVVDSATRQRDMLVSWMKRATLPVAAVLGVAVAAAPFVIPVIDDGRYPDSIPIFQLLMAGALVTYATMPGPNLLMSQLRYRLLAGVYAVALAVLLVVTVVTAEVGGVILVAAGTAFVNSVEMAFVAWLAARPARPETEPEPVIASADDVPAASPPASGAG